MQLKTFNSWGRCLACVLTIGLSRPAVDAAPTALSMESPTKIDKLADGTLLVDFGQVTFGNILIAAPENHPEKIVVHFGEAQKDGRIDRQPPGTVRYSRVEVELEAGKKNLIQPAADPRNTKQPDAILTPVDWGVVIPFRWAEIEGWRGEFKPEFIARQSAYSSTWNEEAASFESSDEMLNRVWKLCKHSVKATTFAGLYVDGDRERIPYEADAYLNQLSHYATDDDIQMARDTFDHLMQNPTWPSEWAPHMVFMAHADWMRTGDVGWISQRYESLKSKLLSDRVGEDGLVRSDEKQQSWNDIVDWPQGERDHYVFTEVNTVVNAFHISAILKMADLARAVGRRSEADEYASQATSKTTTFNRKLFIEAKSAYKDGIGTSHTSLHASLFPLAFDLVPEAHEDAVADFLIGKGMRCSVYAAQYLLEGLFQADRGKQAINLMLADGDRSWRHMVESGTTVTWEAWDQVYKPNQDWNHAWGAAPANLLSRFVIGAQAMEPGWERVKIRPHCGDLREVKGKVPTPLGSVDIHWKRTPSSFGLALKLPEGMKAVVSLPDDAGDREVYLDGRVIGSRREGRYRLIEEELAGESHLIVR